MFLEHVDPVKVAQMLEGGLPVGHGGVEVNVGLPLVPDTAKPQPGGQR